MPAMWLVSRGLIRRRLRSIVALVVLIGVVGGVALSAAAGARRTATSLERFRRSSRAADVELAIAPPTAAQIGLLRHSPHVVAIGTLSAFGFVLCAGRISKRGVLSPIRSSV